MALGPEQPDQRRRIGLFPDRDKGRDHRTIRQRDRGHEIPRHALGGIGGGRA